MGLIGTIDLLLQAFKDRDPACAQYSWALLYLKVNISFYSILQNLV